jgi:hypothetical protein
MFRAEVVEKIKTHVVCSVTYFNKYVTCELMWKNAVEPEPDRAQMSVWNMRIACCKHIRVIPCQVNQ